MLNYSAKKKIIEKFKFNLVSDTCLITKKISLKPHYIKMRLKFIN